METIENRIVAYLARSKAGEALKTGTIAIGLKLPTGTVNRACRRLEVDGKLVRVVRGNPTSWGLAECVTAPNVR